MGTLAGDQRTECVITDAGGDIVLHGPVDGGCTPCTGGNVGEGVGALSSGLVQGGPQEGDSLGTVGGTGGIKLGLGDTAVMPLS